MVGLADGDVRPWCGNVPVWHRLSSILTQDTPDGSLAELRARGQVAPRTRSGGFMEAAADPRVWALFAIYGSCFGMELTIDNIAALYFSPIISILR